VSIDASLVATPPMGFNTWNRFGLEIDERLVRETIEALVEGGLRDAGYRYVNLDDGWMAPERDRHGRLTPDPKRFPNGIAALVEEAHRAGLKLGLYSDCGTRTCGGLPASYGHERDDAETLVAWGIDYLKQDWCHVPFEDFPGRSEAEVAEVLYGRISDALVATGHPVVLSMCCWGHGYPWEWARGVAHLWRTTGDIADVFSSAEREFRGDMVGIFHRNVVLADFAGPGGFNDPDMLEVGNGGMSAVEYQSHFALWCLMAAPLLIGTDVRSLSPETAALLKNRALIAVNQDPLGRQARLVQSHQGVHVLVKPLAGGEAAVGVFNERDRPGSVTVRWGDLLDNAGAGLWARDLWTGAERRVVGAEVVQTPPHATLLYRLRPAGVSAGTALGHEQTTP
jgi:alpha-galactosidase